MTGPMDRYWAAFEQRTAARHFVGKSHPRDPKGQWTEKGPGGADSADPSGTSVGALRRTPDRKLMHPEGDGFYQTSVPNTPLTGQDRENVLTYAWGGPQFEQMNRVLRGDPDRPIDQATAEGIKQLTSTLDKHVLTKPTKVYRGVPDTPHTREWLAKREDGGVVDHGFMSTSTDPDVAELSADPTDEGGGFIFEIKLPTGTKAASLGDQFDDVGGFDQKEILLQRGSKFKVGRRRKVGGRTHVELKLVAQS